jgi:hypothetical protein
LCGSALDRKEWWRVDERKVVEQENTSTMKWEGSMEIEMRYHRRAAGVSLDELSAALGPGFSRARLSVAERGLIELSVSERQIIVEAIERLGLLRSQIRRVVDTAKSLDLTGFCVDLRKQAAQAA